MQWSKALRDRLLGSERANSRSPLLRRAHAFLFLAAALIGGIASMDALTMESVAHQHSPNGRAAGGSGRAFIFMIDSLRRETASDPQTMPALVALRGTGVSALVQTTRDAVTVPALRAAFTGRDRTAVLAFVRNFLHGDAEIESLFSQAHAAGIRCAAYSDGSFLQFGAKSLDQYPNELGNGDESARQDRAFRSALDDFRSGDHDMVIAHLTYGDHRAHEGGIRNPRYPAAFRRLDTLVREAAERVLPDETLVVMGDHGHDELGNHTVGLDVPTIAIYRGASFRPGVDLGKVPIAVHRYLAGWALRLPLSPDYTGPAPSLALVPPVSGDYARAAPSSTVEPGIPVARHAQAVALAAYVGILGLLWLVLLLGPLRPSTVLLAWAALLPFAVPGFMPWNGVLGAAFAVGAFATLAPCSVWRTAWPGAAALAGGIALAFMAWGRVLVAARPLLHHPKTQSLVLIWLLTLMVTMVVARKWGTGWASWVVLGVALFLTFPTVYPYGTPNAMGPAWLVWLVLQFVPARSGEPVATRETRLLGVAVAVLVSQFLGASAANFQFTGWRYRIVAHIPHGLAALATVAVAIVLLGPGRAIRRLRPIAAGSLLLGAAAIVAVQFGFVSLGRAEIVVAAVIAAAAALLERADRPLARGAWIGAGLLATHALIRAPVEAYQSFDILLLTISLSALLARRAHPERTESAQAFLLVLAAIGVGWTMFAWSMSRMEWHFLYDWLDEATVERHIAALVPIILARFAIPLWLMRLLLVEQLSDNRAALRLGWVVAGAKAFTLVLTAFGMGWVSVTSDVYLEAVQHSGVWLLVLGGLV